VAYNSLLIERRRVIHGRTAEGIEAIFHQKLEDHYGELGHHYSRSGNVEKAVEYLHKAGQQAVQRSAHTEAIGQFTAALELLKPLPQTPERIRQELSLCIALGTPLVLTKGHAAPEVEAVYTRARELCQQGEETPQMFSVLLGLRRFYFVRGELQTAAEFGG
jgi:predicted ATPase